MEEEKLRPETIGLREAVVAQVNDCLWLDDLKTKYNDIGSGEQVLPGGRCIVCSLPLGTCKHNNKWLDKMAPWNKILNAEETVDEGMDDVMNVLDVGSTIAPTYSIPEYSFDSMRWCRHVPRVADVIGADKVQVSFPGYRGFHTAVVVGEVVVVFGGLQYKKTGLPQPFTSSVRPGDVLCLNDMYLYHIVKTSWHRVQCNMLPEPRYGHCCTALDGDTMIMFGGRNQAGKFLSDTWFFSVSESKWTALKPEELSPPPSGRVFSAICSLNDRSALLFGGTDGAQNFGDIWIFRSEEWRWERGVTAGLPPSPRYGHAISVVRTNSDEPVQDYSTSRRSNDNLEVIIMGGCAVNPVSEISAASEGPLGTSLESQEQAKRLAFLNKALQDAYAAEGYNAMLSGQVLSNNIEQGSVMSTRNGCEHPAELKEVYQEAARSAARISALEVESRNLENSLLQTWYEAQALHDYNKRTARHPNKVVDTYILSVSDMVWMSQKKKSITGKKPAARMSFMTATMGGRYIVLKGGVLPTALGYRPIDKDYTLLYMFDTQKLTWKSCTTMASKESMNEPLYMAEMEIARANQRVEVEHRRGMMLGAPGGLTAELLEARRLAEVSKWRKEMLLAELETMIAPPAPRWGGTAATIGSRILLYGGWTDQHAAKEEDTLVLDAEDDLERSRRLEDEFQARIETERLENEARGRGNDLQSAFELRMILAAEREREANERRIMGVCDILSRLPELTRPNPVRFLRSNEHTIWVEWDPVYKDAYGKPVENVEYLLLLSGGYVPLGVNDRVEVKPSKEFMKNLRDRMNAEAEEKKLAKKKSGMAALDAAIKDTERGEAGQRKKKKEIVVPDIPFFRGEIVHSRREGTFDIRYDDVSLETRVKRERIDLEYDHPDPATLSGKAAMRLRTAIKKKEDLKLKEMSASALLRRTDVPLDENRSKTVTFSENQCKGLMEINSGDTYSESTLRRSPEEKKEKVSYLDDLFNIVPLPTLNAEQLTGVSKEEGVTNGLSASFGDTRLTDTHDIDHIGSKEPLVLSRNFHRTITQDIPSSYRVVYRGANLQHICEGIVPVEVVNNEPDLTVSVKIGLMTIGTDYPDNALSQMSDPIECSTRRSRMWDTAEDPFGVIGIGSEDDTSLYSKAESSIAVTIPPPSDSPDKKESKNDSPEKSKNPPLIMMSKKKKDIVTAVLQGNRTIEMERKKASIRSTGIFDHFV